MTKTAVSGFLKVDTAHQSRKKSFEIRSSRSVVVVPNVRQSESSRQYKTHLGSLRKFH